MQTNLHDLQIMPAIKPDPPVLGRRISLQTRPTRDPFIHLFPPVGAALPVWLALLIWFEHSGQISIAFKPDPPVLGQPHASPKIQP